MPNPISRDEIRILAKTLIKGDAQAVLDGNAAMTNPNAVELDTVLRTALKERSDVTGTDTDYDNASEVLAKHRVIADEWIKEIVEELNFGLRKQDASSKRRIMRNYGFKYDSGDSSQNPLDKPENFTSAWIAPDLTLSWDAVDSATGYYIQFSTDGNNWQLLNEGLENSFTFAPPLNNRYYRVCATNDYEDGVWSDSIQFDPPDNQDDNV